MPEPTTTTNILTFLFNGLFAFLTAVFAGINGVEAAFAFAGAVIFVVASKEFSWLEKILFFILSFIIGIHSADFFAHVINGITPDFIKPTRAIGALASAALSVNFIIFLIAAVKNPIDVANKIINLVNKFRGKANDIE